MRIYVGNLSRQTNDEALRAAFAAHGSVASAEVVKDRDSQASRGFGFVEMPTQSEAEVAVRALQSSVLDGSEIKVNEARPRNRPAETSGGGFGRL